MPSVIISLIFVAYAFPYIFTLQSNIVYNDLTSLSNTKISNAQMSTQSDMLYLLTTPSSQTKVIAINFTNPFSLICSTFFIDDCAVAIIDDDFVITNSYSILQLNDTQLLWQPTSRTFTEIYKITYAGMYISVGASIQLIEFTYSEGVSFIGNYDMPTNALVCSFSSTGSLVYYITLTYQFAIMDYSLQKMLYNYSFPDSIDGYYHKIFVSSDSKYIFLHSSSTTAVFMNYHGSYSLVTTLIYNFTQIEEMSNSLFAGKIAEEDSIVIIDTNNRFDVSTKYHFEQKGEYQFKIKSGAIIILSTKGITLYTYDSNESKTFFALNISFIIPLGSVILVMGITILVVCLRIKRKPTEMPVMPAFPQPNPILRLRSDETVVTEENKRMSYGKLLQNLRKMLEGSMSSEILKEPVVIADGYTYERQFIEKWLLTKNESPTTHSLLENKMVIKNKPLIEFIEEWCKEEKQL